jgi:aldehyde:ferredoxin oxidoreductase
MKNGCMGKVLWVDLTHRDIREEIITENTYRSYLSGLGLAINLLFERIPEKADPLGPENILGFVSGLLTGTGSLFAGRWMAVGKSPLTGTWGDANCGGNFSPAIKRCGFDGIFFYGTSDRPVYFYMNKGRPELRDAAELWGKDTLETEKHLKKKPGCKHARIACIGPAGEKLSLISGISNDGGRMAARSGLGAVMGSKRLKAVVLNGARRIVAFHPDEVKAISSKCNESIQFMPPFPPAFILKYLGAALRVLPAQPRTETMLLNMIYKIMLKRWGTTSLNQILVEVGDSPIKNWKGSNQDFGPERSNRLNPDIFSDRVFVKYHCYACPLGCGGIYTNSQTLDGLHKPEYETVLALGGLCMNDDAESIFRMNDALNRAGMDTISAGGVVAFAIECYENGLLSRKDTGGLDLKWGNSNAILSLVDQMINREGLGDVLADGVKTAAAKIQKGSEEFAIHAGGQELAMHDGRFDPGFAVHNCVEATPGRHTIGSQLYYELFQLWEKIKELPEPDIIYSKNSKYNPDREKALASAACSKFMNVINGAGACFYGALLGPESFPLFDWLNAATGWEKTAEDYMEIGERIQTLKQLFNLKHGIHPAEIKMPERALGRPPLETGANKGRSIPIEKMVSDYWNVFDWDPQTGEPTEKALQRLGLQLQSFNKNLKRSI